jgi:murein L,D-transpeptidase YafK
MSAHPKVSTTIDNFNPAERLLPVAARDYPNQSDVALGKGHMGGDVFIHGGLQDSWLRCSNE